MSQENPTPEEKQLKNKETRNRLLLGALILLLVGVVYFQFFSGSDAPNPVASATAKTTPSPTPQRLTSGTPEPIISEPLDLALSQEVILAAEPDATSSSTRRRRPASAPPAPTLPTPTPWPSPSSLNPGNVFARTADFTLTVFGQKMPQDAQASSTGAPTGRLSSTIHRSGSMSRPRRSECPAVSAWRFAVKATQGSNPIDSAQRRPASRTAVQVHRPGNTQERRRRFSYPRAATTTSTT